MSELQPTPSYKTLPEFDQEPTPQQIERLGLRPGTFDEYGQMTSMPQDTALYLKDRQPGDSLDADTYFGIKELAQYGPTGYIYEVGAEAEALAERLLGPEFQILLCRTSHRDWLPLSHDGEEEKALTSVEGWEKYWEILPQLPAGGKWAKDIYLGA